MLFVPVENFLSVIKLGILATTIDHYYKNLD
jgi:hypothetical protein